MPLKSRYLEFQLDVIILGIFYKFVNFHSLWGESWDSSSQFTVNKNIIIYDEIVRYV